jgi:hypothetical protein
MSGTNKQASAQRVGRHPSNRADSQLEHLENMVEYVMRAGARGVLDAFDHEYWEKRIHALEQSHELIASQRKRAAKLRDRLTTHAQLLLKRNAA